MIESLRQIGLSELEARCYLTLLGAPGLTGYEVAKRVSVSRSNVYAALRALTDKGACRLIEGDTIRYDAVPVDQMVRYFRAEFEQTANRLVQHLKTPPQTTSSFYNWTGTPFIAQALKRLISVASRSIVVDIWSEDLHHIEDALLAAEAKGVTVILIVIGRIESPLKNVVHHKRSDEWGNVNTRKFSILCDLQYACLGNFGEGVTKPSAVETENPAVVEVLKNAFYHDVIITTIETDFGPELTNRYGQDYEKITDFFTRQKGWTL